MADEFASYGKSLDGPATRHFALTADADADINPRPRGVYCQADGTITIRDEAGVSLPYTMTVGGVLPFRGVRITAISGGTFYGWS